MFNFFKKLFRKPAPKPVVPRVVARAVPTAVADPNAPRPQVEVAHLSLAAILNKFPEDLKRTVANLPDPAVTVALPLATIHKQLPSGSVKMSLASLYRQAPVGVFSTQGRLEEKRMVEVPLSEIFRHVKPQGLRRRNDQRRMDLPEDAYELFGDKENPYAIAPAAPEVEPEPEPEYEEESAAPSRGGLKPSDDLRVSNGAAEASAPPPAAPAASVNGGRAKAKSGRKAEPAAAAPAAKQGAAPNDTPVEIPISALCANWPEPIRAEAMALGDARVGLPASAVTGGVAKGKVTFTWGQIRSWLTPPASSPTQAKEATELILPLKVVAPAFLAHSRPGGARKKFELDDSIPALFSGGSAAKPVEAIPAPSGIAAPASLSPPPEEAPAPAADAPAAAPDPQPSVIPAPAFAAPAPAPAAQPAPAAAPVTIAAMLGAPEKPQWSPGELVLAAIGLNGVSGAVIGLHEGLLVAAELPDHLKGDTLAAFLPQMFARLNNYTNEMKFGQVDELLFTTQDAHFQAYKLGEVYFGVLGKPGEALPWESLRVIADQLARQTSK